MLLQPSQRATKLVEVTLQYDITKIKPERVDIKAGMYLGHYLALLGYHVTKIHEFVRI